MLCPFIYWLQFCHVTWHSIMLKKHSSSPNFVDGWQKALSEDGLRLSLVYGCALWKNCEWIHPSGGEAKPNMNVSGCFTTGVTQDWWYRSAFHLHKTRLLDDPNNLKGTWSGKITFSQSPMAQPRYFMRNRSKSFMLFLERSSVFPALHNGRLASSIFCLTILCKCLLVSIHEQTVHCWQSSPAAESSLAGSTDRVDAAKFKVRRNNRMMGKLLNTRTSQRHQEHEKTLTYQFWLHENLGSLAHRGHETAYKQDTLPLTET